MYISQGTRVSSDKARQVAGFMTQPFAVQIVSFLERNRLYSTETARLAAEDFLTICWPVADSEFEDSRYDDVVSALGLDSGGQFEFPIGLQIITGETGDVLPACTRPHAFSDREGLLLKAVRKSFAVANIDLYPDALGEDDILVFAYSLFGTMRSGTDARTCIEGLFESTFETYGFTSARHRHALQMCLCTFWHELGLHASLDGSLESCWCCQ